MKRVPARPFLCSLSLSQLPCILEPLVDKGKASRCGQPAGVDFSCMADDFVPAAVFLKTRFAVPVLFVLSCLFLCSRSQPGVLKRFALVGTAFADGGLLCTGLLLKRAF